MKNFLFKNLTVWMFILAFIIIEAVSVCFTGGNPLITRFWYVLLFLGVIATIMLLTNNYWLQMGIGAFMLLVQIVLAIAMVYLYTSNGTFFDWAMLNQRNDAFATIEDLDLNEILMAVGFGIMAIYITLSVIFIKKQKRKIPKEVLEKVMQDCAMEQATKTEGDSDKQPKNKTKKVKVPKIRALYKRPEYTTRVRSLLVAVFMTFLSLTIMIPYFNGVNQQHIAYKNKLYETSHSRYQRYGITGNAIYQMVKGLLSNQVDTSDLSDVRKGIYGNRGQNDLIAYSKYNGVSKGNNLIMVLVESWEWFSWFAGDHNEYTESQLKNAFPNLYAFYEDSVRLNNFYSREKTDTAEILSLLGTNPTDKYVHYDLALNSYPWSLPNLLRKDMADNNQQSKWIKSYHQNDGMFYNRELSHESFGFDNGIFDIKDMQKPPFNLNNDLAGGNICKGERTLDSRTWKALLDNNELVPDSLSENERFFSYAITFSMHGYYAERNNLHGYDEFGEKTGEDYYEVLKANNLYQNPKNTKERYMQTYAASTMDFDRALGMLMTKLKETGLDKNTTVVLFADHNAYYNNLSYYGKGIDAMYDAELYRVPCLIYDQKLSNAMQANKEGQEVNKFTTTADLIPTICDIFDMPAWENLYFGNSIFTEEESVIYSRAYGIFVSNDIICYSVKNPLYASARYKADETVKQSFIARAEKLLNKLQIVDKIYYSDYFAKPSYEYIYPTKNAI